MKIVLNEKNAIVQQNSSTGEVTLLIEKPVLIVKIPVQMLNEIITPKLLEQYNK